MGSRILQHAVNRLRQGVSALHRDSSALVSFLFHGVFANRSEIDVHAVAPQQQITVDDFRQFVVHFLENGYHFISPNDILTGLPATGRFAMATFDDGYFNNRLVLPVLREFEIPAVFFISTNHVETGQCFWWDVIHRERTRQGVPRKFISTEMSSLKQRTHESIESYLRVQFGDASLDPIGDIDRPLTPAELAEFSQEPYVHLGNHTSDHAILTNYSPAGIDTQITTAQDAIEQMTGLRPTMISYPNGNYSEAVIQASLRAGLTQGITVEKRKDYLPLEDSDDAAMRLGRFVLWGNRNIEEQCRIIRSDISRHGLFSPRQRRGRAAS